MRTALSIVLGVLTCGLAPGQYNYHGYQPYCPPPYYPPYQQHYQYQYPVQKVVAQEIAVAPLIVTVPVDHKAVPAYAYGAPYYYSSSDSYAQRSSLRDVIREELRNFAGLQAQTTQAVQTAQAAQATKTQTGVPRTVLKAVLDDSPPELQKAVLAALTDKRASCVGCHAKPRPNGFQLVMEDAQGNYQLVKQTSDKCWKIYGMVTAGLMPPAAEQDASKGMAPEHFATMLRWVKASKE